MASMCRGVVSGSSEISEQDAYTGSRGANTTPTQPRQPQRPIRSGRPRPRRTVQKLCDPQPNPPLDTARSQRQHGLRRTDCGRRPICRGLHSSRSSSRTQLRIAIYSCYTTSQRVFDGKKIGQPEEGKKFPVTKRMRSDFDRFVREAKLGEIVAANWFVSN